MLWVKAIMPGQNIDCNSEDHNNIIFQYQENN